jgi:hypothetical protein
LLAGCLFVVSVMLVARGVPTLKSVHQSGLAWHSVAFVALFLAMLTTLLLVASIAGYLVYDAVIRPGRATSETRYLITDKRVLIQREHEELHLDRSRIVDVIDTPARNGLSDVFMVLDGPRARALAASGAFGEIARGPHLRPVFESIEDADGASRILRTERLKRAA